MSSVGEGVEEWWPTDDGRRTTDDDSRSGTVIPLACHPERSEGSTSLVIAQQATAQMGMHSLTHPILRRLILRYAQDGRMGGVVSPQK